MTQIDYARELILSDEMKAVLEDESISKERLLQLVAKGEAAIVKNKNRKIKPLAVGTGLKTKVNANIGTSPTSSDIDFEIEKMKHALKYGADAVMDLSTGGELDEIRTRILEQCPAALGTVPLYQISHDVVKDGRKNTDINLKDILSVIERQAKQGVDFMTIHSGVTRQTVERYEKSSRVTGIVSRGGALLLEWISVNGKENPLYERYDEILDILHEYDVTISIGDGMRPGCLADATDRTQINELMLLGELAERAWEKGVQVMIEGPGHVPLHEVEANILLQKKLCKNAPFYVLGPLVTDIAPGYDHITGAIGGAIAAAKGADFLCYVTPAEHLSLPSLDDVREGVVAFKIAAHAGDVSKGIEGAIDADLEISKRRKALDWKGQFELALDKEKCEQYRSSYKGMELVECTMCGDFCSMRKDSEVKKSKEANDS